MAFQQAVPEQARERTAAEPDFSLVLGGPLYQLLLRAHVTQPNLGLVQRRIIAAIALTWLPLALLTTAAGKFFGGTEVPFLYDLDVHVRFLLTLPLLIAAEVIVHRRVRSVIEQFRERDLISRADRPAFESIVAGAMRLRNSIAAELLLLLLAVTAGYWLWRWQARLHVVTWYADATAFTGAGYWYAFVSVPVFRFVIMRWYYRLFIWYVFLFRVSRLNLQLNALHPDRAGGLQFLTLSSAAILPVLMAQTVFLSGLIGNQIWHDGASLPDFKFLIGGIVGFLMLLTLLPLAFFAMPLAAAKRAGLREYGLFATRYAREFREKWLRGDAEQGDPLGTGDIQSLADLGNSYAVVNEMSLLPFDRRFILRAAVVLAIPLAPLALTMFPFDVLMQQLIKLVL